MKGKRLFKPMAIIVTIGLLVSLLLPHSTLAQTKADTYLLSAPPVANSDSYTVVSDEILFVDAAHGVLANDTDPDGDLLTAQLVGKGPAHGTLDLESNGSFEYIPDDGYVGSDTFVYEAFDGLFTSTPVSVSINVTAGANTPPVARDDSYEALANTTLTVDAASGVLANDTDAEGDPLTAQVVGMGPAHGILVFNADGSFQYTPDLAYVGSDVFVYEASDGVNASNPVNVTINVVSEENTPPVARSDTYAVESGTILTVDALTGVLANDTDAEGDVLTATLVGEGTAHGILIFEEDGSFVYTPDAGYIGSDVFVYEATDGVFTSSPVNVTINVTSITNTPPVAKEDTYEAPTGITLVVDALTGVLANDTDAQGDLLTAILVGQGTTHGTLNFSSDGSFTYLPDIGYVGPDLFIYQVTDGVFTTNPVNVTINVVSGEDTPPEANQDSYEVETGTTLVTDATTGVLANDINTDGDILTAQLVGGGTAHGTLNLKADGSFVYNPDMGYVGQDLFVYQVYDGLFTSNPVNVQIDVISETETPPVAREDDYEVEVGGSLIVDAAHGVLANDTDAEGDLLTALLVGEGTAHGTLSFKSDGSFVYKPDLGYFGGDYFTYQAYDGLFTSVPVLVTIDVYSASYIMFYVPVLVK